MLAFLLRSAHAQTGTDPTVTADPLTLPNALLTPEQRIREEDGRDPREFFLSWRITGANGRLFRVSFGRRDIETTFQDAVPVIGQNDNRGTARDGTHSVLVSEDDLLERATALSEETGIGQGDLAVHILVFTVDDNPSDDSDVVRDAWNFRFDFEAPDAPRLVQVTPGERVVHIQWDRPSNAEGLEFYEVQYCPASSDDEIRTFRLGQLDPGLVPESSTAAYNLLGLPCTNPRIEGSIRETTESIRLDDGIQVGQWVSFAILSQDEAPFRNLTETSTVYAVRTQEAIDFFELQRGLGGGEDGGYCFLATVAYGSYAHPIVRLLRGFRDRVLARIPFGPALIRLYYAHSPPLAEAVSKSPILSAWVRAMVVIWVALGIAILLTWAVLVILMVTRHGLTE